MYSFEDLVRITAQLRSEHGCPWDRKQTHESLMPCLKEERRHPHVFGDAKAATPEESLELWNEIKRQEKLGKK